MAGAMFVFGLAISLPYAADGGAAGRFAERVRAAIEVSRATVVVYEDVLGEGRGGWDDAPLDDKKYTNCILWFYAVLRDAYLAAGVDAARLLAFFRYFESTAAYGLRKHYTEHWLAVEPGPLRAYKARAAKVATRQVTIDPRRLARANRYPCALYRPDMRRFRIDYLPTARFAKFAPKLPVGIYVAFMVPAARYLSKYAKKSGPMGLVHALIVDVAASSDARAKAAPRVHHASVVAMNVLSEDLGDYLRRTRGLYAGVSLYTLDPDWRPPDARALSAEAARIVACEADLVRRGIRRQATSRIP